MYTYTKALVKKLISNPTIFRLYLSFANTVTSWGFVPIFSPRAPVMRQTWVDAERVDRKPTLYIKEDKSLDIMFGMLLGMLDRNSCFLEIGSNCGRSLNYLYNRGYKSLQGIELGQPAVDLMAQIFPQLTDKVPVEVGDAAELIKTRPDESYDVVFCHSVLVNIPPSSNSIFKDMVRCSRRYILIAENEESWNAYPRNFQKLFSKLSTRQVFMCKIGMQNGGEVAYSAPENCQAVTIRIFLKI